jgi:hypothetical protein
MLLVIPLFSIVYFLITFGTKCCLLVHSSSCCFSFSIFGPSHKILVFISIFRFVYVFFVTNSYFL